MSIHNLNGVQRHQEMMDSIKPVSSDPEIHGQILFVRTSDNAVVPSRKYMGDVGYDLYLSRSFHIGPYEVADAFTDINIYLPLGFGGFITGRSSSTKNHGVLIIPAVMDQGYTGPMHIQVQNLRNKEFSAAPGDRIAQLIIQPIYNFEWVETLSLPETERGTRGFGSSGR